jgi:hypothetical protein
MSPDGKGKAVSVLYALVDILMSATFVYIRLRMTSVPQKDGVPAAIYICSESGCTVEEFFID